MVPLNGEVERKHNGVGFIDHRGKEGEGEQQVAAQRGDTGARGPLSRSGLAVAAHEWASPLVNGVMKKQLFTFRKTVTLAMKGNERQWDLAML
ncbi:Hypothetical protein NTJ_01194 [Nesidiocoris tenuis]|uniref:Uncharacterized protein n=1 Tax=Nesidiocoris tenuis TaxID=355587 RepID=A0ABN7A8V2_9HEMI|nr:Hypothetical protein NTJ_01194 [Nesidiocoris tenuis]